MRFKRDFKPITRAISKLQQINGYYHYWNNTKFPDYQFSEGQAIGFKAQEIQEVFPQLVSTMPDGYLAVNYAKMAPLLVEAIKEQQVIIADLLVRIKASQAEVTSKDEQYHALVSRIEKLELGQVGMRVEK